MVSKKENEKMSSMKEQRIRQLVAVCVKKSLTPKKTAFCDFILRVTAAYYSFSKRTAKQYVDILIRAYHFDRWKSLVENNIHLEKEEQNKWINSPL